MKQLLIIFFLFPLLHVSAGDVIDPWLGIWKHESLGYPKGEVGRLVIEKQKGNVQFHLQLKTILWAPGIPMTDMNTDDNRYYWTIKRDGVTEEEVGSARLIEARFNARHDVLKLVILVSNGKAKIDSEERSFYFGLVKDNIYAITKEEANKSEVDRLRSLILRIKATPPGTTYVWKRDDEF